MFETALKVLRTVDPLLKDLLDYILSHHSIDEEPSHLNLMHLIGVVL